MNRKKDKQGKGASIGIGPYVSVILTILFGSSFIWSGISFYNNPTTIDPKTFAGYVILSGVLIVILGIALFATLKFLQVTRKQIDMIQQELEDLE